MAPDNGWCWNTFSFPQLGCCLFSGAKVFSRKKAGEEKMKHALCLKKTNTSVTGQLKATNVPPPPRDKALLRAY